MKKKSQQQDIPKSGTLVIMFQDHNSQCRGGEGGGGSPLYKSPTLCAVPKGMVIKPFCRQERKTFEPRVARTPAPALPAAFPLSRTIHPPDMLLAQFFRSSPRILEQKRHCSQSRSENGFEFRGQVGKRVTKNYIFWSEIESGFGEPSCTPRNYLAKPALFGTVFSWYIRA